MTSSADSENDLSWLRGTRVLVAGGRVSGQATIEPLVALGAVVTVADSTLDFAERCAELGCDRGPVRHGASLFRQVLSPPNR